jgi:hypothetical protein
MRAAIVCLASALLLAACATPGTDGAAVGGPAPPALGLFSRIRVPAGHEAVLQLSARGAQIFRCEHVDGAYLWRFRQPEAELFDGQGRPAGRHGAGYSFEHRDGSRLVGTVAAHDDAASADTLPWLLLSTRSYGQGALAGVSYVQRVNTRGGMPPAACSPAQANRPLRVDFAAEFVFYRPRP